MKWKFGKNFAKCLWIFHGNEIGFLSRRLETRAAVAAGGWLVVCLVGWLTGANIANVSWIVLFFSSIFISSLYFFCFNFSFYFDFIYFVLVFLFLFFTLFYFLLICLYFLFASFVAFVFLWHKIIFINADMFTKKKEEISFILFFIVLFIYIGFHCFSFFFTNTLVICCYCCCCCLRNCCEKLCKWFCSGKCGFCCALMF